MSQLLFFINFSYLIKLTQKSHLYFRVIENKDCLFFFAVLSGTELSSCCEKTTIN